MKIDIVPAKFGFKDIKDCTTCDSKKDYITKAVIINGSRHYMCDDCLQVLYEKK